jgi:hypothetical protein
MSNILLYGKPSFAYNRIKNSLKKFIEFVDTDLDLIEIQNTRYLLDQKVSSIPAVEYQGKLYYLKQDELDLFIENFYLVVLSDIDYGALHRVILPYSPAQIENLVYVKLLCKSLNALLTVIVKPSDYGAYQNLTSQLAKNFTTTMSLDSSVKGFILPTEAKYISFDDSKVMLELINAREKNLLILGFRDVFNREDILELVEEVRCPILFMPEVLKFNVPRKILFVVDEDITTNKGLQQSVQLFRSQLGGTTNKDMQQSVWNTKHKSKLPYEESIALENYCRYDHIDLIALERQGATLNGQYEFIKKIIKKTAIPILLSAY